MMNRRTPIIAALAAAASLMLASCTPESPPLDPPGYGENTTASETEKTDTSAAAGNTTTTTPPAASEEKDTDETYNSSGVQNTPSNDKEDEPTDDPEETYNSSGVQGTPAFTEETTTAETYDSSGVQNTPPPSEDSGSTHKNKDRWYRIYKLTGGGYEDYIEVEFNQKQNYVSMHMMFIGVNAYMSVDSADLAPIDGQYWIQDFMNADGSEPDLTKVYMKYTASKITLYYWDANEEAFDFSQGQQFVFSEEFTSR